MTNFTSQHLNTLQYTPFHHLHNLDTLSIVIECWLTMWLTGEERVVYAFVTLIRCFYEAGQMDGDCQGQ